MARADTAGLRMRPCPPWGSPSCGPRLCRRRLRGRPRRQLDRLPAPPVPSAISRCPVCRRRRATWSPRATGPPVARRYRGGALYQRLPKPTWRCRRSTSSSSCPLLTRCGGTVRCGPRPVRGCCISGGRAPALARHLLDVQQFFLNLTSCGGVRVGHRSVCPSGLQRVPACVRDSMIVAGRAVRCVGAARQNGERRAFLYARPTTHPQGARR